MIDITVETTEEFDPKLANMYLRDGWVVIFSINISPVRRGMDFATVIVVKGLHDNVIAADIIASNVEYGYALDQEEIDPLLPHIQQAVVEKNLPPLQRLSSSLLTGVSPHIEYVV